MSNLYPFEVKPKEEHRLVGNQSSGILKFPVYYSLLVSEQIEIDEAVDKINPFVLAAELACRIQQETGEELLICSAVVMGREIEDSDFADQVKIKYARAILSVNNYSEELSKTEKLATVTAVMKRIVPEWGLSETLELSTKLFDAIWEFALSEIKYKKDETEVELTEEAIKKPLSDRAQAEETDG